VTAGGSSLDFAAVFFGPAACGLVVIVGRGPVACGQTDGVYWNQEYFPRDSFVIFAAFFIEGYFRSFYEI
jgi:hypothetical protein